MKLIRRLALTATVALALVTALPAQVPVWPKTTPADIAAVGFGVQVSGADYGNGTFVLSAYFGSGSTAVPAVWTSPDGTTWTRRTLPVTGAIIAEPRFLNGKFYLGMNAATNDADVPTGANGAVLSSADGITWSAVTLSTPLFGPGFFTYGNGVYIGAARPVSSEATQIITSTDGVTWTPRIVATNTHANGIAFFNGKFYCTVGSGPFAAALYTSSDGVAWTRVTTPATNPGQLTSSPTALLVNSYNIGNSTQMLSTDGVTFTSATPGLALASGTIRYVNGSFVAPAQASSTNFVNNQVRASFDGRTWTTIATRASVGPNLDGQDVREIVYGNGRYVFVGEFDVFSGTTTISPGGTSGGGGGTTAPAITTAPPATQSASLGGSVTFAIVASGTGNTYQWRFNTVAIPGATSASYTLSGLTAANAGSYTVTISNAGGTITSNASVLTVAASGATASSLTNLSIRSNAGSGAQTLIVGVTVGGAGTTGTKNVLIRGIGPALAAFGLTGALADPKLDVYSGTTVIASNDNWDATATPLAAQTAAGAFPLTPGSRDSALIGAVSAGGYSVQLTGVGGATGIALAELYDLTPAASFSSATPRLINLSARTQVGTGGDILITGFNLSGTGPRRLLIRAVGPTLAAFGVTGTLADPKLDVYSGTTVIASNDNWDSTATPLATQTAAGAFQLAPGSRDAVLIVNLAPGSYTAQVSGVGNTTGVALVEIYELP